jgi:MATE family multidrug resistance protein
VQKYFIEARSLLALAIPVIIAQISQTAMGVVDTIMAGAYSATDMAAVAVGTSIWLPAILFGHGLLLALTPVIAQLNGAGRRDRSSGTPRVLAGLCGLCPDHFRAV